jgi:hypothetical protein
MTYAHFNTPAPVEKQEEPEKAEEMTVKKEKKKEKK